MPAHRGSRAQIGHDRVHEGEKRRRAFAENRGPVRVDAHHRLRADLALHGAAGDARVTEVRAVGDTRIRVAGEDSTTEILRVRLGEEIATASKLNP